jgi:hypothetical protein
MENLVETDKKGCVEEKNCADAGKLTEGIWSGTKASPDLATEHSNKPASLPSIPDIDFKDLQHSLEKTRQQMGEIQKYSNTELYDRELSRRSMVFNPYKILTAGSGLAMLNKSPEVAAVPLTGFAVLQGYDDVKNLGEQKSFGGISKYSLGLLADCTVGAGAGAYVLDAVMPGNQSIPMRYKAALVIGGMAVRAALDFIPTHKK